MTWVHTYTQNSDNPSMGTASSTFTDTDNTTFTFSKAIDPSTDLSTYENDAVAARNAWQTQKSTQNTVVTDITNTFTAAGE